MHDIEEKRTKIVRQQQAKESLPAEPKEREADVTNDVNQPPQPSAGAICWSEVGAATRDVIIVSSGSELDSSDDSSESGSAPHTAYLQKDLASLLKEYQEEVLRDTKDTTDPFVIRTRLCDPRSTFSRACHYYAKLKFQELAVRKLDIQIQEANNDT